jgi:hypothetical protein
MRRCNCSSSPRGFPPGSLKKIGMLVLLRNMIDFQDFYQLTKVKLSPALGAVKARRLENSLIIL